MDNYKELYEKEKAKNIEYIEKLARLEEEKNMLAFRLDRIHNNLREFRYRLQKF